MLSNNALVINEKRGLCKGIIIIVPTEYNGGIIRAQRKRMNVLAMMCLRSLVGMTRMDS